MKKKSNCKVRHGGGGLKKLWLIMRLSVVFLFITLLSVSASTYSQQAKLSVKLKNATLKEVLQQIQNSSEFEFFFNHEAVDLEKRISLSMEDASVEQILTEVLKTQGVSFKVVDNVVFLIPVEQTTQQDEKRTIKGKVVDAATGELMIGVNLVAKRGSELLTGTATDPEGNFDLLIPSDAEVLVVSMIGFKNIEIPLTEKEEYFIELEPEMGDLDEVVVTGYFTKSKESFTGSAVKVSGDELRSLSPTSVFAALSVVDPAIELVENNDMGSNPNVMPEFIIRGRASFTGNPNTPLFVLDGFAVKQEVIFDLDVNRIENVTILKDASATALYGSRAANGVILIETKLPEAGKIRIHYNVTADVSMPDLRQYNLMDAREKLEFERLSGLYSSDNPEIQYFYDYNYNEVLKEVERGVDTYWLSQPLRTSVSHLHSVYAEGGSDKSRYGLSFRFGKNKGVMKGSGRDRLGLGFQYQYDVNANFNLKNEIKVDQVNITDSPYGSFKDYGRPNPYDRMTDEYGNYLYKLSYGLKNPLYEANLNSYHEGWYLEVRDNLSLDWRMSDEITFRAKGSIFRRVDKDEQYIDPLSKTFDAVRSTGVTDEVGSYNESNKEKWGFQGNATLSYHKFVKRHLITGGIGSELVVDESFETGFKATGYPSGRLTNPAFASNYDKYGRPMGKDTKYRRVGFFANATYGFDNRFFIDGSFRYDGSSEFGKNKRFAPFWSAGLAWAIHNEPFMKDSPITTLKLRSSTGVTGGIDFKPYQAQTTYMYDVNYYYSDRFGAKMMALGNPNLKWQQKKSINVGLDLRYKQWLDLTAEVYRQDTDDLLVNMNVTPSIGFSKYMQNAGVMRNEGFEVKTHIKFINKTDLLWSVNGSIRRNWNEIIELSAEYKEQSESTQDVFAMKEGESIRALKLVPSAGIDPSNGKEIYITPEGKRTYKYDPAYTVVVGNMDPQYQGVFGTMLQYKSWNVNLQFVYELGRDLYNQTVAEKAEKANPWYNADLRAMDDRWQAPGDVTYFRNIENYSEQLYRTTRFMQTANTLRLNTLNIEYVAPRAFASKLKMKRLSGGLNMKDVLYISTVKRERGLNYPFAFNYSLFLKLQF